MIIVTSDEGSTWTADGNPLPSGRLRALVRPDGRTCLYFRDCADHAYGPLLDAALPFLDGDLYTEVAEDAAAARRALDAHGFAVHRREHHYAVPTAGPANAPLPDGFVTRKATEVDVAKLAALDDALRADVPGATGWHNDPTDFARQTFDDPEFDADTYLVAVDADGAYAGLVRVWRRPQGARLGLIGVLPPYRRRGLAVGLLAQAFAVLAAQGEAEVTCEVDEDNVASNALMRSLGARRTGGGLELKRAG